MTVADLERSIAFYRDVLGLQLAQHFDKPKVAFFWLGAKRESMIGLWEVGPSPQKMVLHVALRVELHDLLEAPAKLSAAGVIPRDFAGSRTEEPVVLAWMPAASLYFRDPDDNLLEFLTMLPGTPRPDLGVVSWSNWKQAVQPAASNTAISQQR